MSSPTIGWQTAYGSRHLVVQTAAGRWALCNLTGSSPSPDLPCTECLDGSWALMEQAVQPS